MLCNRKLYLVQKHFYLSKVKRPSPQAVPPHFPLSPAPRISNLLSVSMELLILDMPYKWNKKMWDLCIWLLLLSSLVFGMYLWHKIYQCFTPFLGCIFLYNFKNLWYMHIYVCIYLTVFEHSFVDGHLSVSTSCE